MNSSIQQYTQQMSCNQNQQGYKTFGKNSDKEFKAGHFVVNPPNIRPYTFYDNIKLDKDFYGELVNTKSKASFQKERKQKERLNGLLKAIAVVAGGLVALNYRKDIQKFLVETFDSIRTLCKK